MFKLQLTLLCLSLIIIKSAHASPIEKARLKDENWLKPSSMRSFSGNSIDSQKVKMSPDFSETLNKFITEINENPRNRADRPEPEADFTQSFFSKCEDRELNDESKLDYLSLYFDLQQSMGISDPSSSIVKSQLRVYSKSIDDEDACECKSKNDEQLNLSLYKVLSKNTFLPFKVSKKQLIETIKFNKCCDRLITFDLTSIVDGWKLYPDSNNGLTLEITDQLGNTFNINDYIQSMNCSVERMAVPNFNMAKSESELPSSLYPHFPTLDVSYNRKTNIFKILKSSQQLDDREDA